MSRALGLAEIFCGRNLQTSPHQQPTRAFRRKKQELASIDPKEAEKQAGADSQDFIIAVLGTYHKTIDPKWTKEQKLERSKIRRNFDIGLQKFHNDINQDFSTKLRLQWAAINSLPTFLRNETLVDPREVDLYDPKHTLLDVSYYPKPGRFFDYKPILVKKKKREEHLQPMMQEVVLDDEEDDF